jgi:vacuolar-type H+-ATPase subunit H
MTKISRSVIAALVLGALVAGLSGCQKKEGPAERAGKEIDKALEKTDQQIDKSINKAGEKMEKAGEKMQDKAKDLKK